MILPKMFPFHPIKTTGGNVITGRSVDLWINGNIYSNITNNQGNAFFKLNQATGVYGVSAMYASVAHLSSYIYKLIYITDGNMNNDYQTWTDDYNDYQCLNNTLIINLANQLTANCNSDLEKAVAIHSYVSRMNYRLYGNGLNDAYNSLMLFMGNCVDQSNAFMAIAKKAGLIVRGVTGVDSNLINGHKLKLIINGLLLRLRDIILDVGLELKLILLIGIISLHLIKRDINHKIFKSLIYKIYYILNYKGGTYGQKIRNCYWYYFSCISHFIKLCTFN